MGLIVVGAGGFSREVIWLAKSCGEKVEGFLDDGPSVSDRSLSGIHFLGCIDDWVKFPDSKFIVAIGSPRIRKKVVEKMLDFGLPKFATLIHPSVIISETVMLSEGCIICAGCILTVEINLGKHSIVNINTTVGHDSCFGDYLTIAPMVAVSGNVTAEDGVEIGTGASIRQGATLRSGSMLGMGSTLTKNCESNGLYFGSPAKLIKSLSEF